MRGALANAPQGVKLANVDGRSVDLTRGEFLSLGQLARVIGDNKDVNDWLRRRLRPSEWVVVSLAPVLKDMAELRNPVAHRERFSREQMVPLRDRLVGVGCMGQLVELGKVRLRG